MKPSKQCPHTTTVQVGDEAEIRTYCSDCGECVKMTKAFRIVTGIVDSHGDMLLPGAFTNLRKTGSKFLIENHKTDSKLK